MAGKSNNVIDQKKNLTFLSPSISDWSSRIAVTLSHSTFYKYSRFSFHPTQPNTTLPSKTATRWAEPPSPPPPPPLRHRSSSSYSSSSFPAAPAVSPSTPASPSPAIRRTGGRRVSRSAARRRRSRIERVTWSGGSHCKRRWSCWRTARTRSRGWGSGATSGGRRRFTGSRTWGRGPGSAATSPAPRASLKWSRPLLPSTLHCGKQLGRWSLALFFTALK